MFHSVTPLAEIVLRVTLVYGALIVLMRVIAGRREIGQLTPLDLLGMLLLSETVSPVFTRADDSLPAGLVAAATLLVLSALVGRLTHASRRAERWIDGEPVPLIEHGRIDARQCARHRITQQELEAALRKQGVLDADRVQLAMLEPDGTISVVEAGRG
jgi:uncharacterized membrane protein YcaP (DUF421 family)